MAKSPLIRALGRKRAINFCCVLSVAYSKLHQWFLFVIPPVVLCAILNVETQGIVISYGAKIQDVLKDRSMRRNLHRYVEEYYVKTFILFLLVRWPEKVHAL